MTEAATSSAAEWYIITDDAALTLRITPGLTLGEAANGELALMSHEDAATQWVRFDPALDGTLTLSPIDKQVALKLDESPVDSGVEVVAGTEILLPNNRLRISNHFRGQDAIGVVLRISHSSARRQPPLLTTGVSQAVPAPRGSALAAPPSKGPASRSRERDPAAPNRPSNERFDNALVRRRDRVGSLLNPEATNLTEEALVPVSAEAPFADEELKTFLEQPIDLRDTGTAAIPTLTTTTTPQTPTVEMSGPRTRSKLGYAATAVGIALFGLLSVQLTLFLDQPDDGEPTALPPLADDSLVLLPAPSEPPADTQVQRPTDALLRSVDKVIAEGDAADPSVWDFAIRTYEFVLAQEPDNAAARLRLQEAKQTLAALNAGSAPPAPEQPDTGTDGSVVTAIAEAAEAALPPALTPEHSDMLNLAEQRLELGQVISPKDEAAVPLILGVLGDNPTAPRAINLLNYSASLLLRDAEAAWASNDQYGARNILEEIFSFHPRHAGANLRWSEWTGLPPRVPPAVAPVEDLSQRSPPLPAP